MASKGMTGRCGAAEKHTFGFGEIAAALRLGETAGFVKKNTK
jgi:hypothetical protein